MRLKRNPPENDSAALRAAGGLTQTQSNWFYMMSREPDSPARRQAVKAAKQVIRRTHA